VVIPTVNRFHVRWKRRPCAYVVGKNGGEAINDGITLEGNSKSGGENTVAELHPGKGKRGKVKKSGKLHWGDFTTAESGGRPRGENEAFHPRGVTSQNGIYQKTVGGCLGKKKNQESNSRN